MRLYRVMAILGVGSVAGSLLLGFAHDPAAPAIHYLYNLGLLLAFLGIHSITMMPAFKKAVYGSERGSNLERRVYVTISVVTWVALYLLHFPMPGPAVALPHAVQYLGASLFVVGILAFFEGTTFEKFDALIGMPGTERTHALSPDTPLLTEGSYSKVRHPLYRGAVLYALASILLHPNAAQAAWALAFALAFVLFIPIEEAQLRHARGDQYVSYQAQVRYRLVRGIW